MITGPWPSLLPTPKHVEGAAGSWRPASAERLTVRLHSAAAAGVAAWLYLTIDVVNGDTLAFCGGGRCALVPIAAVRSVLQGGLKAPFTLCLVTTQGRRFHLPIALTGAKIGPLLELLKERVPSLDVYVTVLLE